VGPTTVRDAVGSLVGIGLNPLTYVRYSGDTAVGVASVVSDGLYARAAADQNLKALSASATDLYASFRSYYLQNRAAEVNGGRIDLKTLPDFDPGGQAMADLAAPQDEPASSVLTQPKAPLWPKSSGPEDIEPPYRPQSLPDARDRALSPDQGSGGFDAALGATIVVGPPLS
jgi:phospholipid-binding lipoprotein MlaA